MRVPLSNNEKQLPEGVFTDRELNLSVGRKVIILVDVHDNIPKTNKMAGITEIVMSLDELDNTDNLENRKVSNILLGYHVTANEAFTSFELAAPQYKKLKNREFKSLTLRIKDQNSSSITDGLG